MISMLFLAVLIAMANASPIEENEFILAQNVEGINSNPSVVSLPNGYFFMVWENTHNYNTTIYGQTFLPNGSPFCDEFQINQANDGYVAGASATILDDKIFVVWSGGNSSNTSIYGRFLSFNGTALSDEFIVNSNTTACHRSQASVIDLINGNALVVWYSNQTGDYDIYARLFSPNGTAIGDEFIINSYASGDQRSPSVFNLINGNIFVLWSDGRWGATVG